MKGFLLAVVLSSTLASWLNGCVEGNRGVYAPPAESERNPLEAQRLTMESVDLMRSDPARAEHLLRSALTADLYHGPAHNNLGVIYLSQGKLYEAASEFEWARKLLPGNPDPRVNLALTLERAGRTDEAIAAYESALEATPEYVAAIQGLTRLELRSGKSTGATQVRLREIAMRGETLEWREWARRELTRDN